MSIAEATDFLRRHAGTDSISIDQHDRRSDLAAITNLAETFQDRLCPRIGLETLDRFTWAGRSLHLPESLICDLAGSSHLHGGENGVIATTESILAEFGLTGRLAIADTIGAAWAIANCSSSHATIVPYGERRRPIENLPCRGLRLAPETIHTLARLGVETIGQVLALPRSGLAPRLGQHLVCRIAQVLGDTDETIAVHHTTADDTASLDLEYPTDDWPILHDRIGRLCEKVRAGLATRGCGALHVTCCLALTDHPPLTLDVSLFAPTLDIEHWLRLIGNAIEAKRIASPVHHIVLSVPHTAPLRITQTSLLDDDIPDGGGSELARLVDSLSSRIGRDRVRGIRMTKNPLPENAYVASALAGRPAKSNALSNQQRAEMTSSSCPIMAPSVSRNKMLASSLPFQSFPCAADVMRRPLQLLPQPHSLNACHEPDHQAGESCTPKVALLPELQTPEFPSSFRYAGQAHKVVRCWGPERIETSWWEGNWYRRDYFRVETSRGQWWWIFRDLSQTKNVDAGWYLHGLFA